MMFKHGRFDNLLRSVQAFLGTRFQCVFYVFSMCFMSTIVVYSSWLRSSILDPQGWIEWGLEILSELLTKQIQAGS